MHATMTRTIAIALTLAAASPAAAQFGGMSTPLVGVSAYTYSYQNYTASSASSEKRAYETGAATVRADGSQAGGYVDLEAMTVKARSYGAERSSYVRAWAYLQTDIWFLNVNPGATPQPFQAFFHGTMNRHGTRGGWAWADMAMIVKDANGSQVFREYAEQSAPYLDESGQPTTTANLARPMSHDLSVPLGYSRYTVYLGIDTEVSGQWEASFQNTVNLFLPKVAGITYGLPGTAGTKQFVPEWAGGAPTTTAPEPASLALVATGALTLATAARLRRRRAAA